MSELASDDPDNPINQWNFMVVVAAVEDRVTRTSKAFTSVKLVMDGQPYAHSLFFQFVDSPVGRFHLAEAMAVHDLDDKQDMFGRRYLAVCGFKQWHDRIMLTVIDLKRIPE